MNLQVLCKLVQPCDTCNFVYKKQFIYLMHGDVRKKAHFTTRCKAKDDDTAVVLQGIGFDKMEAAALLRGQANEMIGKTKNSDDVESVLMILMDSVHLNIGDLKEIVLSNPGILKSDPKDLEMRCNALDNAWPSASQLRKSVLQYPSILGESFFDKLQTGMSNLMDIGFNKTQTAQMIVKEPGLVEMRRYELMNILKRFGIGPAEIDGDAISCFRKILEKNPSYLTAKGRDQLESAFHFLTNDVGIDRDVALHVLSCGEKCIKRCALRPSEAKEIVNQLQLHGLDIDETKAMLVAWPRLFSIQIDNLSKTLAILKRRGIGKQSLLKYPNIFSHSPVRVTGPRLSYIAENIPEKLGSYSLSSFLAVSDDVFERKFVKPGDDFDQFRTIWIAQNTSTDAESQSSRKDVRNKGQNDQPSNTSHKSISTAKEDERRPAQSPAPAMNQSNRTSNVGRKQGAPKRKFWKRLKRIDGNKPASR
eukprot:jgi/Picsp_1/6198/NSC_03552-R1_EMB2219 [Arabidopsis lyrata subsp. lyrata]